MTDVIEGVERYAENPLDLVERLVLANQWPVDRAGEEELAVYVEGNWSRYHLWFTWREAQGVMQFCCIFDLNVQDHQYAGVCALLALINERLGLGHFEYSVDDKIVMFRYAMLLDSGIGTTSRQVEDLLEIALSESERYFPAFMFMLWGGMNARKAFDSVMLETLGEA